MIRLADEHINSKVLSENSARVVQRQQPHCDCTAELQPQLCSAFTIGDIYANGSKPASNSSSEEDEERLAAALRLSEES